MCSFSAIFGLSGEKHAKSLTRKQSGKKLLQSHSCGWVAASSAAWGWLRHRHPLLAPREIGLCRNLVRGHSERSEESGPRHCERSEAISLHHSLFLVRHSIFTTTFAFLLLLFLIAAPAQAKYGGGRGTADDPYLIFDANQMNAIGADSNDWDKHFKLMADIDLSGFTGTSFNIIGELHYDSGWVENPFTGVFDGNGRTISNFSYASTAANCIGLFGYVADPGAEIKDLGLIKPNIIGEPNNSLCVGSLAGYIGEGKISNCYVEGGSVSGGRHVGGLAGYNYEGSVTDCYSRGSVSGESSVGGLVGENYGDTITSCYSAGSVSGMARVGGLVGKNGVEDNRGNISSCYSEAGVSGEDNVGGLVGENRNTITNCYSTGGVSGNNNVGGLVGFSYDGTISNCYSMGTVSGILSVGGLVGYKREGEVTNSFWDIETSGQLASAGGTGKTTDEMQTAGTFIAWACEPVWTIDEGNDYPRLWWENAPGEAIITRLLGGGTGTQAEPYLIYTAEQLNAIALFPCIWDKHFKLMADIDLSAFTGTSFNIIGYWVDLRDNKSFTGVFDGNGHTISNFGYSSTDENYIGLFGYVRGKIKDLGLLNTNVDAGTGRYVGSLVGRLRDGTISNSYSEASVSGTGWYAGGLVGWNDGGTISNCYSTGSVSGNFYHVGGLAGCNYYGTISNCYSTGSVSGNYNIGGLVGWNYEGTVMGCFWDVNTSGQLTSAGGTGLPTAEMQMASTFTDAGWDFTTPVWTIDEGVDYPRLWWELVPVLHAEPEVTLWTSNTISWDPVPGANDYYAECAEDANFTSIISNSGWITETSFEFTGLQLGRRYWYSVKARNSAGIETRWSNVESSLQLTLADAVDMMLAPESLKNKNIKNALLNKINAVQQMLDDGLYTDALNKLRNDVLEKMNGCAETGEADKNDWIITCEGQSVLCPLVIETIEYARGLME